MPSVAPALIPAATIVPLALLGSVMSMRKMEESSSRPGLVSGDRNRKGLRPASGILWPRASQQAGDGARPVRWGRGGGFAQLTVAAREPTGAVTKAVDSHD